MGAKITKKNMDYGGLMGKYIAAIILLGTWEFENWRACRLVFSWIPVRNPQAESTQTQYKRERRTRIGGHSVPFLMGSGLGFAGRVWKIVA